MSEKKKIILVTGVTSGIGEAVAVRLAGEGHQVVGGARRADRLATLKRENLHVRRVDVTDRADMAAFVDETVSEHGRIDAIVNNAGVMPLSRMDALLVDEWDTMIDVNVRGLLNGTYRNRCGKTRGTIHASRGSAKEWYRGLRGVVPVLRASRVRCVCCV